MPRTSGSNTYATLFRWTSLEDPALAGLANRCSSDGKTTHKIRSELGGMWPGKPLWTPLALPRGKTSHKQHWPAQAESRSCCPRAERDGENMEEWVLPSTVAVVAGEKVSLDRRGKQWGRGNERGNIQGGLLANLHLGNALVPA